MDATACLLAAPQCFGQQEAMQGRSATVLTSRNGLRQLPWLWIVGFCLAGLCLRLGAAIAFPTIERPDEIYQNLEPAYRLWTGQGIVTWEWRVGIRSWLFPGALSALMSLTSLLHLSDGAFLPLIWAALSLVSCGTIAVGVWMGWRRFGTTGALLCGILTTFWPDLVYFGPKTLGEVQSGNLLVVAAALASVGPARRSPWRLATIGALLGAAFDLRFQLSLSLLLVAVWAARLDLRRSWIPLLLGAALPLALLGLVDWWTLGSPFQSIWKNILVNFVQNKAAYYGVQPFYEYFYLFSVRNGGVVVPMLLLFCYGFSSAPLLALTTISVVLFHSLISHKEISFIYAALPCAMVTIGLGASRFVESVQNTLKRPLSPWIARSAACGVVLATLGALALAERPFAVSPRQSSMTSLLGYAHAQRDLCGLGWYGEGNFPWIDAGGYTFLRRPVPIYLADSPEAFDQSRAGFNYAIANRWMLPTMSGFSIMHCAKDYCLFHQPVQCQPMPAHEISAELVRTNQ